MMLPAEHIGRDRGPAWAAVCGVEPGYRSQRRARHAEHAATSLEPMRFRRRRKREESHDNYGF